jgi:hypothetical protein
LQRYCLELKKTKIIMQHFSYLFALICLFYIFNACKNKSEPTSNIPKLIFKLKFNPNQERLGIILFLLF